MSGELKNPDKVKGYRVKYYKEHRAEIIQRAKAYHNLHREEQSVKNRERRLRKPDFYRDKERARQRNRPEDYLWYSAKCRAKKRGIEFNLEVSDIVIPEYCPVLGILLKKGEGSFKPNSPSLDRIDNLKGYVKDNIVVVSFRANTLKSDATSHELKQLATFYAQL